MSLALKREVPLETPMPVRARSLIEKPSSRDGSVESARGDAKRARRAPGANNRRQSMFFLLVNQETEGSNFLLWI